MGDAHEHYLKYGAGDTSIGFLELGFVPWKNDVNYTSVILPHFYSVETSMFYWSYINKICNIGQQMKK